MNRSRLVVAPVVACSAAVLLSGCPGDGGTPELQNLRPTFLGVVTKTAYDGVNDDLLTAGLGATGLGAAAAPPPANPTAPTAAELRRIAIFNNYRAILDINPKGGYGVLYGPNIDVNGNNTLGQGKIAGTEYLAYADDGTGKKNVTLMVQVPNSFTSNPKGCIVTAVSSGSRGVYGAIGSAGEWGLKHGCAVAYADKGTGSGVHDLSGNTVNLQDGTRTDAITAGANSNFTAALSAGDLAAFNAANPMRFALKHAHSQQNPEKDWGNDTLNAVRFALYILNEQFADKFADGTSKVKYSADNTFVIASSVSNGGGAAIAAAEQDTEGLIDGVAVAEPTLELMPNPALIIQRGATSIAGSAHPLFDYYTLANLYQPCAALSPRAVGSPGAALIPAAIATSRCSALKAKGLLTTTSTAAQAEESLDKLLAYGYQPESNILHASHYLFGVSLTVVMYANAYGRFSVADNLCGYSYAATDASNKPTTIAPASLAQIFGVFNGVGNSGGINIVNNLNPGGPLRDAVSASSSSGVQDFNTDGAACHRNLWVGSDANAARVKAGVAETLRTANLHGKPAIIVAGRSDTQIPVNFNARPYFGQNQLVEGPASRLSYIEVTNAQHFDTFIDNAALPGYDSNFVPLHYYFIQAMDRMWAYLTSGTPLPPSQLVRTTPRGGTAGSAPQITTANVPQISATPVGTDLITFSGNTLTIPD